MKTPAYVGIDNGGTWIRLVGLGRNGKTVWSIRKPSPPLEKLPSYLKKELSPFKGELHGLALGSKGVWKQSKRNALKRALRSLAKKVLVMSDVEAAWHSAFKSEGIVIISGTGSIAYGRNAKGRRARAGGLGPDKSDEGSGYWIGKEWLKRRGTGNGGRKSIRNIASMAKLVIKKAKSGHLLAKTIVTDAQCHLADLVQELATRLKMKRNIPLSVAGSILKESWFKKGFLEQLNERGLQTKVHISIISIEKSLALLLAAGEV